jgi:beta-N-acetylhexosaminidase
MKFTGLNLLKQIDPAKPIPSAKFIPGDRNIYMLISRAMITIVITLVFVLFTGCLGQKQHLLDPFEQENKSNETGKTNEKEFSNKETDPIKKRIDEMTLEEKIGQMVIVGFEGSILNDILKSLIYDYCVSGFIFYERNIENSNQLLELTNSLKKENEKANNVPIFLSIDEEGGRVSRIPKDIKNLPSNGVIGKINDGSLSYKIGKTIGEKTKIFGFNMDFAPVLDINNNPKPPIFKK